MPNGLLRHSASIYKGLSSSATPPIPTEVALTVVSDTAFSVAYTSLFPVEIWYSTDNITYTKHGDDTATPYAMTGLTQGTLYYVKIRSVNGSKYSAFTPASSATTTLAAPTVLTSQFVVDTILGQVDFTDNSGGVAQHEVYSNTNAAGAVLLTTLATGIITYNDTTCKQNASVVYTVRAKKGTIYSGYATASALVTPLCWKTNQTTRSDVVITTFNISAGGTVNIDWGDGVNANYTGNNAGITHTYAASAVNIFDIKLSGDTDKITSIIHNGSAKSYGNLTNWIIPSGMNTLRMYNTPITGEPYYWNFPQTLVSLYLYLTEVTGRTLNMSAANAAMVYRCYGAKYSSTGSTVFRVAMIEFDIKNQGASFPTSEIDKLLKAAADWYQVNAPTANCTFDMSGANMGIPSLGASNTDLVRLTGYYTNAGKTATVVIRTS